jgi:hypothetical protein
MNIEQYLLVMNGISLPQPSFGDLKGRQSVRATFKLSPEAIETLSIVAIHLGIKQKSVFDHLTEDGQSLKMIAQKVDHKAFDALKRVPKTFVISRRALLCLEKTAGQFNASRDALVEMSIQRLLPIISREKEKHEKRKKILKEIDGFMDQGRALLEQFEADLGGDDPVVTKFKNGVETLEDARGEISDFITRGQMIEHFNVRHSTFRYPALRSDV